jgi:hypothetical protein
LKLRRIKYINRASLGCPSVIKNTGGNFAFKIDRASRPLIASSYQFPGGISSSLYNLIIRARIIRKTIGK